MNDRRLGFALLAALILLDVVLIGLALRPAPAAPMVSDSVPTRDEASETASAAPAVAAVPARFVAFRAGGLAFAATPGTCTGEPSAGIEIPALGPAVPAATPGAVLGRLTTNPDGTIVAVAGAQDCTAAQQYAQQSEGGSWNESGSPEGLYFAFVGSTDVATPAGPTPTPCPLVSMVSNSERAAILCADGRLLGNSGGADWTPTGNLPSGVALAPGPDAALLALHVAAGCEGLAYSTTVDGGRNWTGTGCVQGATASGPVGVAALFDAVVVVDGQGTIFRSGDGGASFTKGG